MGEGRGFTLLLFMFFSIQALPFQVPHLKLLPSMSLLGPVGRVGGPSSSIIARTSS